VLLGVVFHEQFLVNGPRPWSERPQKSSPVAVAPKTQVAADFLAEAQTEVSARRSASVVDTARLVADKPVSRLPPSVTQDSPENSNTDGQSAVKNGAMLGGSLLFTSTLGVLVSLLVVPNAVDLTSTGILGFGEALAAIMLVFSGFGMDTYLRKELAVRRNHASSFFSGLLVVRVAVSFTLTMIALTILIVRQSDLDTSTMNDGAFRTTLLIVLLFCMAQFFQQTADSFSAMLQAIGQVRLQTRFAVLSKVVWALLVLTGLGLGLGIWIVPAALLVTEAAKTVFFGLNAQRELQLSWRPDISAVPHVIKAAAPFLVTAVSVKLISFMDIALVKLLTGDDNETAYYRVALSLSTLALLLAPLIQWVVLPLASKAVERSRKDFAELVFRSYQWVLCAGIPLSLLLGLNADVLIRFAFQKFDPAIPSLRILSALIVLSYVSILGATLLIADGRSWRVVRITFVTIGVDLLLNGYMIKHGWQWWGQGNGPLKPGGAGIGASISLVTAELIGSSWYLWELRKIVRRVSDPTSRRMVGRTLVACAVTVAVDFAVHPLGIARPFIDLVVLAGLLIVFGVIERRWIAVAVAKLLRRPTGQLVSDDATQSVGR
jgi:O-antigen/teichoic acid export membrane protein